MAKQHVSAACRGLPAHPAVFLAITPEIRRALEMLAEASISLLDEIDRPVDDLEADDDFEITREDDEDGGDDEAEPVEPDLGWSESGEFGGCCGVADWGGDEDFVEPETSGGFPGGGEIPYELRAEQKALFDPRLALRTQGHRARFTEVTFPDGRRGRIEAGGMLPRFPHDHPGRAPFFVDEELRRLRRELKVRRNRRNSK